MANYFKDNKLPNYVILSMVVLLQISIIAGGFVYSSEKNVQITETSSKYNFRPFSCMRDGSLYKSYNATVLHVYRYGSNVVWNIMTENGEKKFITSPPHEVCSYSH